MKPDLDQLGLLLHDGARLLRRRFELRAAGYGLSSAQWRLLVHVLREDGVTQARLAERLEIEPISVSRLVDRMEHAGWVARLPDPADRRIKLITATDNTKRLQTEIKAIARAVYDEATEGLDATARDSLLSGLRILNDTLARPPHGCDLTPTKDSEND